MQGVGGSSPPSSIPNRLSASAPTSSATASATTGIWPPRGKSSTSLGGASGSFASRSGSRRFPRRRRPEKIRRVAVLRGDEERVTPLELFFDLVFVLAITQCTALMAAEPTWEGVARGVLVLCVLWWCWVGYAWLTSAVDPEEGVVRIAMFASMAALLVAALAVPHAFNDTGLIFAVSYGIARYMQVVLLYIAGRDNPSLRRSVITGLSGSTAIGIALLITAS